MNLLMHPTSYGTPTVHGDQSTVHIGKYCSISNSATFDAGMQHNPNFVTTYPLWRLGAKENKRGMSRGDTHVGNDVWIGDNTLIMSGVRIGNGAIVGAHAVVTKDVQPYTVVVGVPARLVKWRFTHEVRQTLLRIKWWDWPEEKILALAPLMLSEDLSAFLEAAGG